MRGEELGPGAQDPGALSLVELEERVRWVTWREPIWIAMSEGSGWGCRVCIARNGITGIDTDLLFRDGEAFRAHFEEHL